MGRSSAQAKVICFTCRESTCDCVAGHNVIRPDALRGRSQLGRAAAWLGGACVAGTALGAALALLLGT